MRRRLLFTTAALATAAAGLLGGVLVTKPDAVTASGVRPEAAAGRLLDGFAAGDTASYAAQLEQRVEASPEDAEALMLLGLAYQQRARETGDPGFYPRSEDALRRSLELVPENDLAVTGLAALAASRHRFDEARRLARRALDLNPSSAAALGILGDANVETGRYRAAFAAFDRMAALKPSAAAYARVSYARELLGHTEAALAAMQMAADAAAASPEPAAWALVELGNLHFSGGRLQPAERAYRAALARFSGYHRAQAALARVQAARGRTGEAAALYRRALEAVPLPEYAAALGDALAVGGKRSEAREAFQLVGATQRLLEANGVRTDVETAFFDLDHGGDSVAALARAREAFAGQRGIEAEGVLAWALYRNGRCEEALAHSERSLRLGTRDALKVFHRGMIERCLGRGTAARASFRRALEINPYFSLRWAPVARRLA